ncbi:MAG TPA: tetratricopeptide repeat protein [Anaerolineae bacterium]
MSKKKHRSDRQPDRPADRPLAGPLIKGLQEVEALSKRKRWDEVIDRLESLNRRYPNRPEVLTELVNAYLDTGDMRGYLRACENLSRVVPNDPDVMLSLAGGYMTLVRPALAVQTLRRFLERWPHHPRADEVRKTLAEMEPVFGKMLEDLGASGEEGINLALQHETVQSYLDQGRYQEARQEAEALLRRHPHFAPALNNISQSYFAEGKLEPAIAASRRVLEFAPDNVHALSNLARFLVLNGRADEAGPFAERLKASTAKAADVWYKKAEALSVIGDDQGVLDILRLAEQKDAGSVSEANAMLYHLAAVAALRLGREDEARKHWRKALKLNPNLELAQANLDDLRKPVGERHAPWAFALENWVPRQAIEDMAVQIEAVARRDDEDEALAQAARRYLRKHPEVIGLAPILLDRGDPHAREFALHLVLTANTPELLAAACDFALGQRGPDSMRMQAAHAVSGAGLLPAGLTRLWVGGEWRDLMLMGFELHGEPLAQHQPQVESLLGDAIAALHREDSATAERLLKQALQVEPDKPDILNNLAVAYEQQGRTEEAHALLRQVFERHPDYLFARTGMVRVLVRQGEVQQAKALMEPVMSQQRFHFSEFSSLCSAQIEILLAENGYAAARSWLDMWADANPDDPLLAYYRQRVGQPGRPRRLFGR